MTGLALYFNLKRLLTVEKTHVEKYSQISMRLTNVINEVSVHVDLSNRHQGHIGMEL